MANHEQDFPEDHDSCGVNPIVDAELIGQGWERRLTASEPRLSEAVEAYQTLGFEVHLEPFDPGAKGRGGCTACFDSPDAAALFKTVYTRRNGRTQDKGLL